MTIGPKVDGGRIGLETSEIGRHRRNEGGKGWFAGLASGGSLKCGNPANRR